MDIIIVQKKQTRSVNCKDEKGIGFNVVFESNFLYSNNGMFVTVIRLLFLQVLVAKRLVREDFELFYLLRS